MKVLALELSSPIGSITLLNAEETLADYRFPNDRKDSGPFFARLKETVAQVRSRDHDAPLRLIVGLGPGSYAGVRIALAAAIGLAHALKAELIGYSSLCALEMEATDYCVIGDARRGMYMLAAVRDHQLQGDIELLTPSDLEKKLAGETRPVFASALLPGFESARIVQPAATTLARCAFRNDLPFSRPPLEPIYLREPHITSPRQATPAAP